MKTQIVSKLIIAVLFLGTSFSVSSQDNSGKDSKKFQVSFVYPVGSNGQNSGQISNDFSFNVLAGYTGGVERFELGGIYNLVDGRVKGAQISGFGNAVRGDVNGFQLAGFLNTNKGMMEGVQIAGFSNLVLDDVEGIQIAGFLNTTRGSTDGLQLAGFLNIATFYSRGLQLAGFSNISGGTHGAQISGFVNRTGDLEGVQLAGFANRAKEVKGVQVGIVNIADSVSNGTQVGLVNISRNGILSPGLESDDVIPFGFAFRSGQEHFYTILSVGFKQDEYWALGAGVGSRLFFSDKSSAFLNPELRWQNLHKGKIRDMQNNNLVRLNFNFGYELSKHLYLTAGPSVNFFHTSNLDDNGHPRINLVNNPTLNERSSGNSYQLWIGYNIGIGF